MNTKFYVICNGKKKPFTSSKEALNFYENCLQNSEGSEQSRYASIVTQILTNESEDTVSDGVPELNVTAEKKFSARKESLINGIKSGKYNILSFYDVSKGCIKAKRFDRDIMLECVKSSGWYAMQFLTKYYSDDEEFILETCKVSKNMGLGFASERLKNDKDFVLKTLSYDGNNLYYASDVLKEDFDIITAAFNQNHDSIQFVGKNIFKNMLTECSKSEVFTNKNTVKGSNKDCIKEPVFIENNELFYLAIPFELDGNKLVMVISNCISLNSYTVYYNNNSQIDILANKDNRYCIGSFNKDTRKELKDIYKQAIQLWLDRIHN